MDSFLRLPSSLRRALLHPRGTASLLCRYASSISLTGHDGLDTHAPTLSESSLALSSATLNSYATSITPAQSHLKQASAFFTRSAPTYLFSAAYFRSFPPSPFPEVAFLGRSNVGKSSLLNALFGRPREKPAHVSKRPGRTKTMNGYGVGGESMVEPKPKPKISSAGHGDNSINPAWKRFQAGGIVVVDMPGYGAGSREEWGAEIMKYLQNRKQLRRTYVLIDTEHGLKSADLSLLVHLRQQGIAHQIVLSKVDKLLFPGSKIPGPQTLHERLLKLSNIRGQIQSKVNQAAREAGGRDDVFEDILCCSAEKSIDERGRNRKIGIDELRCRERKQVDYSA